MNYINTNIATYILDTVQDKERQKHIAMLMEHCHSQKLRLLWQILFEIDIKNTILLEKKIYEYGSLLKEHDYFERELFIGMISILQANKG
ncbi:MAG: hypothetical protein IKJ01_01855 [Lachnospiraceae bacterium]|nr:hypothetical protein [Lachnospiraceae bacterium]